MTSDFYDEQGDSSLTKSLIVRDYFSRWASVMAGQSRKIGYFDLFCGPGRYKDGSPSTPLLILEYAIATPAVRDRLVAIFNDEDTNLVKTLEREIAILDGIGSLHYAPQVTDNTVTDDYAALFASHNYPALTFLDPWGYKGLTRKLIGAALGGFGCEVVFFFNYNRLNAAISNGLVEEHVRAILSEEIAARLASELSRATSPTQRERLVVRALGDTVTSLGGKHLIPFKFRRHGGRTSHYLVFSSKHPLGYLFMKEVMADLGVCDQDSVPKFEYLPGAQGTQLVFDTARPILELPAEMLETFAGREIGITQLINQHHPGTPFIRANYRRVVLEMEQAGALTIIRPKGSRSNTLGEKAIIRFPKPD